MSSCAPECTPLSEERGGAPLHPPWLRAWFCDIIKILNSRISFWNYPRPQLPPTVSLSLIKTMTLLYYDNKKLIFLIMIIKSVDWNVNMVYYKDQYFLFINRYVIKIKISLVLNPNLANMFWIECSDSYVWPSN